MNYHKIYPADMVNGEGVRVVLFVSGCIHACPGCYNESTWNPKSGEPYTQETEDYIIECLRPDYIQGLSLSGGDPLHPRNLNEIMKLIIRVQNEFGDKKDIWLWSGFTFKEILDKCQDDHDMYLRSEIIAGVDVFIDGKFEQDKHEHGLKFRGSTNQIIHYISNEIGNTL